jgi:serine/threonine protein kinase
VLTTTDEQARLRFTREIMVMKALPANPYVVGYVADGITDDDRPFIAMEYVKGFTLGTLLRSGRRLTESAACTLMMQLCDAFGDLHKLGLTHGDIKPDNIMLSRDEARAQRNKSGKASNNPTDVVHLAQVERTGMTMKLLDFGQVRDGQGLLRLLEDESMLQGAGFGVDPETGVVTGTPEYIAPEQVRDAMGGTEQESETDTPADVFGLGVIFYELLAGGVPWPFGSGDDTDPTHQNRAVAYLRERGRNLQSPSAPAACSPALWSVIARALHADPKTRQGDARLLAQDIDRYHRYGVGVPGDLDNEATVMAYLPDLDPTNAVATPLTAMEHDELPPPPAKEENRRVDRRAGGASWRMKALLLTGGVVTYALFVFDLF